MCDILNSALVQNTCKDVLLTAGLNRSLRIMHLGQTLDCTLFLSSIDLELTFEFYEATLNRVLLKLT